MVTAEQQTQAARLLEAVAGIEGLRQKPAGGNWYFRSRAFLHFHVDARGLYADVKLGDAWVERTFDDADECDALIAEITAYVEANRPRRSRTS